MAVAFTLAFVPLAAALLLLALLPFDSFSAIAMELNQVVDGGKYVFFVLFVAAIVKTADQRLEEEAAFNTEDL